ncbi:uncharacterized protein, partial [Halyomorpha halys]|uniref:uncharacterized protein n=1 Tax=Halyomorpha halys TaxID=286706 RepID=UPI0034D2A278
MSDKNKECVKESCENQGTNKNKTSNTTDLCQKSHIKKCCKEQDGELLDKLCSELDKGIFCELKNDSCSASDICNRNSSYHNCNKVKVCCQSTCCKNVCECNDRENATRICDIPTNRNFQNFCCRNFRMPPCPTCAAFWRMRYRNFMNNCNVWRKVPQIFSNSSCLELPVSGCEGKCKKDDKKTCRETHSFNICTPERLWPKSLTCKQYSNHNCLTINDCMKSKKDSCKVTKPDPTSTSQIPIWCKCFKIVYNPMCQALCCSSDIISEESNTKPAIGKELCCDTCSIEESKGLLSDSSKCKKECCCLVTDSKNSSTNCMEVSKLALCKICDACNKELQSQDICEVNPGLNTKEECTNKKHNYEKSLCGPLLCKKEKSLINESQDSCKENIVNCSSEDLRCSNICNHDMHSTPLINSSKIISFLKNHLTKECSKKINFICELVHKKCNNSISKCNNQCTNLITDLKSSASNVPKSELTSKGHWSICNNIDVKEKSEKCAIKKILSPCTENNNECTFPIKVCKSSYKNSKVSQHIPCKTHEICCKINENFCKNLEHDTETPSDHGKDCTCKSDIAKPTCDHIESKIKTIPCTKKKLRLITCHNDDNIGEND